MQSYSVRQQGNKHSFYLTVLSPVNLQNWTNVWLFSRRLLLNWMRRYNNNSVWFCVFVSLYDHLCCLYWNQSLIKRNLNSGEPFLSFFFHKPWWPTRLFPSIAQQHTWLSLNLNSSSRLCSLRVLIVLFLYWLTLPAAQRAEERCC